MPLQPTLSKVEKSVRCRLCFFSSSSTSPAPLRSSSPSPSPVRLRRSLGLLFSISLDRCSTALPRSADDSLAYFRSRSHNTNLFQALAFTCQAREKQIKENKTQASEKTRYGFLFFYFAGLRILAVFQPLRCEPHTKINTIKKIVTHQVSNRKKQQNPLSSPHEQSLNHHVLRSGLETRNPDL